MWENAISSIVSGDLINGIFLLVMAFVTTIVNLILLPFSLLIKTYLPDLNGGLEALAHYFTYAGTYMGWILNAFAIPSVVVTMIASYYLFTYTTTLSAWGIKLILKWKKAIWA